MEGDLSPLASSWFSEFCQHFSYLVDPNLQAQRRQGRYMWPLPLGDPELV
jgi:hypothetical protein